jgi:hypothetical protein
MNGSGVEGFALATPLSSSVIGPFTEKSVVLEHSAFASFGSRSQMFEVIPILEDSTKGSRLYLGNFFGNGFSGQALNAIYQVPQSLMEAIDSSSDAKPRIFATLMCEKDSCRKEINPLESAKGKEGLKLLTREAVDGTLKWSLFLNEVLQKEVTEKAQVIRMEDGMQYARSFGNSKIYPWADQMPFSLGSALGFIDKTYSLLALEEDVLPAITADKYLLTGVPTLNLEDIFPAKEDTAISTNAWSMTRGYNAEDLLLPAPTTALNRLTGLPQGMRFSLRDGRLFIRLNQALLDTEKGMGISIFSIKGKRVKEWGTQEISRGEFSWSPSESGLSSGAYVIKVSTKAGQYSQTVFLR